MNWVLIPAMVEHRNVTAQWKKTHQIWTVLDVKAQERFFTPIWIDNLTLKVLPVSFILCWFWRPLCWQALRAALPLAVKILIWWAYALTLRPSHNQIKVFLYYLKEKWEFPTLDLFKRIILTLISKFMHLQIRSRVALCYWDVVVAGTERVDLV